MNKTCARCEKTVYPTEELKCLDKVWHKGCFKCQECGMTLNMRTYKGYGKLPYCEAHVPKAKSTTMAETPELKRIAENTKLQSNVKYHADFEKSKGKFTQVADDPETLRIKANTKIISNVAYHGDLEKKAQMEKQRQINENGELVEVPTDYNQQLNNYATEMLPPALPPPNLPAKNHYQTPTTQYQPGQHISGQNHMHAQSQHMHAPSQHMHAPSQHMHAPNHHNMNAQNHMAQNQHRSAQNHKMTAQSQHMPTQSPHMSAQSQHMPTQSQHMSAQSQHMPAQNQHMPAQSQHMPAQNQHMPAQSQHMNAQNYQNRQYQEQYYKPPEDFAYQYTDYQNAYGYGQQQNHSGGSKIGRIEDYDPVIDPPRAPPNTQRASATLIYNSTSDGKLRGSQQPAAHQQSSRQIGRVTDMDPMANEPPRPVSNQTQNQQVYIAMYDYEANDSDEVSFREGDLISNVSAIDEGWMTGRVLRSGRTGMLPANYVELAPAGALQHRA